MLTLALAAVLAAAPQEPKLTTTVRLVVAPATVTDRQGRYTPGLTAADFLLLDNGRPRKIDVEVTYVPISLVIAVQTSDLAASALQHVRKMGSLIEPLVIGAPGEAAVVGFDREIRTLQPFTSDVAALKRAIAGLDAGGDGGALADAVLESVRLLATRPPSRRRVLLLISEARDRSSKGKLEDAVTRAQRENVMVYCATFSAFLAPFAARPGSYRGGPLDLLGVFREIRQAGKKNAADALARYTGGVRLGFVRHRALERAVSRIGEDLHSQYWLSFTVPEDAAPEFHRIEVRVRDRGDLVVRTRPGYWPAGTNESGPNE